MSARHPRQNPRPGTAPSPAAAAPPRAEEPEPGLSAGRLAYSVDEAARLTGLSRDLLYKQMRQGNLDYLKIGRRRLITRRHLEHFLAITPRPGPSAATAGNTRS
jgi:excisionase family DNA binding protein